MQNKDTGKTAEFIRGARDTIPLLLGALPFGLIYGTMAITAGMSRLAAAAMSAVVFAGSAQFIAVGLVAAGTPAAIIVATTFVVNLRHMLYSATLLPKLKTLSISWRAVLAFFLTDETFAVSVHRWNARDNSPDKQWYQLGSSLAMYLNWQFWCFSGTIIGTSIPNAAEWGLDVAMPVTFIGMTIPFVRTVPMAACVAAAGLTALLFNTLPYKAGLMLAAAAGISTGLAAEKIGRLTKNKFREAADK